MKIEAKAPILRDKGVMSPVLRDRGLGNLVLRDRGVGNPALRGRGGGGILPFRAGGMVNPALRGRGGRGRPLRGRAPERRPPHTGVEGASCAKTAAVAAKSHAENRTAEPLENYSAKRASRPKTKEY